MLSERNLKRRFEKEQYNDQANLVYISSAVICILMAAVFQFWIGSTLIAILNVVCAGAAVVAVRLNHHRHYSLGALVFFIVFNMTLVIELYLLGFRSGFQYMIFNFVGLIIFTSWKPWQKFFGVMIEASLFIVLFFLRFNTTQPIELTFAMTAFLQVFNILLSIAGVANSSNYYIRIATRAHDRLHVLAMKDYLTNMINRTSFDGLIADLFMARKVNHRSLGILLLDIDHFKRFNDTCGHLCGDELLRQFAAILLSSIRSGDFAARFGGEEFVILLGVDQKSQLEDFAERLRGKIENEIFVIKEQAYQVTASIGALYIPPDLDIDHFKALDQADKLMYRAKAEGRNRAVCGVGE